MHTAIKMVIQLCQCSDHVLFYFNPRNKMVSFDGVVMANISNILVIL